MKIIIFLSIFALYAAALICAALIIAGDKALQIFRK